MVFRLTSGEVRPEIGLVKAKEKEQEKKHEKTSDKNIWNGFEEDKNDKQNDGRRVREIVKVRRIGRM